jgi:D-alanine transaminase
MLSQQQVLRGMPTATVRDTRWDNCHIKSASVLSNVQAINVAHARGYSDVMLFDKSRGGQRHDDDSQARQGGEEEELLLEGATSNVFLVIDGELWTAPVRGGERNKWNVLPGITRDVILTAAAPRAGIPVRLFSEAAESVDNNVAALLQRASEAFFTSTTREILPVSSVQHDGVDYEFEALGPVTRKLYRAFVETVEDRLAITHYKRPWLF